MMSLIVEGLALKSKDGTLFCDFVEESSDDGSKTALNWTAELNGSKAYV